MSGGTSVSRDGCRHPICAPWNSYPTGDGQVLLCSSTEAQWRRLLTLIGADEMAADARFVDMGARARNVADVDSLVGAWTGGRTTAQAAEALSRAGVPAGPIRSVGEMLAGPGRAWVRTTGSRRRCVSPLRLIPGPAGQRRDAAPGRFPLSGIRVVEVGPFTAGPLAGRLLADLGADVVKIEPPGGEASRRWAPRFNDISLYFANYNAGKRSVVLDLSAAADRTVFGDLLGTADVLLQNLKPGALAKLGYDPTELLRRHPGLNVCSISGYGADGSRDPALDTVIQASSGAMALVDYDAAPCKIGFSAADLIAGHLAAFGIVAALRHRDRTGQGTHIDLSMQHALFWATQAAWDGPALGPYSRIRAGNAWVVAAAETDAVTRCLGVQDTEDEAASVLARLRAAGIRAQRVRDIHEVFADPLLAGRGMVRALTASDGSRGALLGAPFGLTGTPPRESALIGPPDADRAAVIGDWLRTTAPSAPVSTPA
jgi:crotonobetainyl-CoA:carnitine CoA-transferase CaiB-like acyl-CoA transferase